DAQTLPRPGPGRGPDGVRAQPIPPGHIRLPQTRRAGHLRRDHPRGEGPHPAAARRGRVRRAGRGGAAARGGAPDRGAPGGRTPARERGPQRHRVVSRAGRRGQPSWGKFSGQNVTTAAPGKNPCCSGSSCACSPSHPDTSTICSPPSKRPDASVAVATGSTPSGSATFCCSRSPAKSPAPGTSAGGGGSGAGSSSGGGSAGSRTGSGAGSRAGGGETGVPGFSGRSWANVSLLVADEDSDDSVEISGADPSTVVPPQPTSATEKATAVMPAAIGRVRELMLEW